MKKLLAFCFLAILAPVLFTQAATYNLSENYNLPTDQKLEGNLYTISSGAVVSGEVDGDISAIGMTLLFSGPITSDILSFSQDAIITGDVGGDIRVVASDINITSKTIAGDINLFGSTVSVSSDSAIAGEGMIMAGRATIDGDFANNLKIWGGEVVFNGKVAGDLEIEGNKVIIGDQAEIMGNLTYSSTEMASISPTAVIGGETIIKPIPTAMRASYENGGSIAVFFAGLFSFFFLLKLVIMLVLSLLLLVLFKKFSLLTVRHTSSGFWKNILVGLIVLILLPIISLVLLFTLVGIPVAVVIVMSFVILAILAKIYAGMAFGYWMNHAIKGNRKFWDRLMGQEELNWKMTVWGVLIITILSMIPVIGWTVVFAIFLATFGAILQLVYKDLWLER